ncbi:MAG: indole-3-glycerol phosphate synthase TrpC [Nitrospirae bacterium]|nr:indole-3-glycerol phosphate synthase TrpC [Nitrospirota bacterium]
MSILKTIVDRKRERITQAKSKISLSDLKARIADLKNPLNFRSAIKRNSDSIKLIAEIKKASPSKGIIRKDFDPLKIAEIYEEKSVDAVSVLTEEDYFQGSLLFIPEVKKILTKPVLRKDFIFDEYQIYEARAYQADAILLIAALIEKNQASEYIHLSKELGLSVLFEVHDFRELELALYLDRQIIGINNRNLKTLQIDINTTFNLKKEIPSDRIVVSESGIKTYRDVIKLQEYGIDAMLIGTAFMESPDIGKKIDELKSRL